MWLQGRDEEGEVFFQLLERACGSLNEWERVGVGRGERLYELGA